jgi:hypothetical protein
MVSAKLLAAAAAALFCSALAAVPAESPEETVEPTQEPFVCFPGSASVTLPGGVEKPMASLAVGDLVQVAPGEFSPVFMFTHKMGGVEHRFVELTTDSGAKLALTAGHYIYASGCLVAAEAVNVGDVLELADGSTSPVTSVATRVAEGLYNPQTVHGDIVVDGVRASTYTTAVAPGFAHAALSPLRAVYERLGLSTKVFDQGARLLASIVPNGESVVA